MGGRPLPSSARGVGVSFRKPGAVHHARWLAKANYSLKMFMFREQFSLSKGELDGLREVCMYVIVIYVKIWFPATLAAKAPSNDLQLLKDLINYREINIEVSKVAQKKMLNHLWYLTETTAPLAFFNKDVSIDCK